MVILSIGGNLGDVEATFARGLDALKAGGFSVSRVSSPYRNPAVGCEEDAPDFTNWAVVGEWAGTPLELLDLAQSIEVAEGRPADHPHWRSRTLDIDLISCNDLVCDTPRLTLPHPRWQERDFVLVPLREVAPEWLAENLSSKDRNNGSQKCS